MYVLNIGSWANNPSSERSLHGLRFRSLKWVDITCDSYVECAVTPPQQIDVYVLYLLYLRETYVYSSTVIKYKYKMYATVQAEMKSLIQLSEERRL